ncbi:YuiB family protein [Paenibacillus hodogayensis]|uniref:YuiB family protein n=1 Tax=Paenibacillus hodogayensis TaxID=279208 RepID=A0ABV5VTP3_9BACL
MIDVIQLVILMLLVFVLMYGIGFIFNMLLKTTHFPIYLYVLAVIGMLIYWAWSSDSLLEHLAGLKFGEYLLFACGLAGAILSGKTIHLLRVRGYKMF